MREKIAVMLQEICPGVDVGPEQHLRDDDLPDSLDLTTLVADLRDEFDVKIGPKDITAANFNSLDAITALVESLKEGQS